MRNMLYSFFAFLHRVLRSLALRLAPPELVDPRVFSNTLLRTYAPFFSGAVVNISGWDDRDGEGSWYREYFANKTSYAVTNAPTNDKGVGSIVGDDVEEIALDLT